MPTLAAQITPEGIIAPDYADIFAQLQLAYWSIYGSDAVLDADSQDGQLLGIFARVVYDCNVTAVAIYNAYSPATAQGDNLSSVVKINGIQRLVATKSQVTVTVVGVAATVITNGVVGDNLNLSTQWNLPVVVVIPALGTIDVVATAAAAGAVAGAAGTLTRILTPTRGWQTVTNALDATLGAPVESDSTLRQRQSASTSLAAESVIGGIYAAVANLPGVVRAAAYDNDTAAPDSNGIPAHSIAIVVDGGTAQNIGDTIALKKTPGTGTAGTTTVNTIDGHGIAGTIKFYPLTPVPITAEITIKALAGYDSATVDLIKAAVAADVTALLISEDVYPFRVSSGAGLNGAVADTFAVTLVRLRRDANPLAQATIPIAFNEAATCLVANITVIVT